MTRMRLSELVLKGGLVGGPFGSDLGSSDYTVQGVPVIRGANMGRGRELSGDYVYVSREKYESQLSRNSAIGGDLVFTQRGTLGQVAVVPDGEFVVSQSQMRLRSDPSRVNALYLYYACTDADFLRQVDVHAIRTGVPHINLGILGRLEIPLPDLATQTAIADVLGALDDKIAANDREVGLLDELARSLTMRALAPGHSRVPLGDFAELTMGSSPKGETLSEVREGVPFHQGVRDFGVRQPTDRIFTSAPVRMARAEDVLISLRAPVGSLNRTARELCIGRGLAAARSDSCSGATLFNLLRAAPDLWEAHGSDGTVFASITRSQLESMPLAVPEALSSLDERLRPLERRLDVLVAESSRLASTRDALLPELMSGRLTVRDLREQS